MKNSSDGEANLNSLQIAAEADACLRGEISFQELKMRIWPKLSEIAAARRMAEGNEMIHESSPLSKPEAGQQSSDNSFAEESKSYEEHLVQSLKSLVQRLGASADPLLDIYILGGQCLMILVEPYLIENTKSYLSLGTLLTNKRS